MIDEAGGCTDWQALNMEIRGKDEMIGKTGDTRFMEVKYAVPLH